MKRETYAEALSGASRFFIEKCKEETAAEYLLCGICQFTKTDLMLHLREEMPECVARQYREHLNNVKLDLPI